MNMDSQATEHQRVFVGTDAMETQEGAVSQEVLLLFPFDEALLQAFLAVGGCLQGQATPTHARTVPKCYACRHPTQERCSYCLLPVCEAHGEYVIPWFTTRQVMVCTPCQARLREIEQEEAL